MSDNYIPVLILFAVAAILPLAIIAISAILGRHKYSQTVLAPYECGVEQVSQVRRPVHIRFFAVALAFLIIDVEIALLYPWAAVFRGLLNDGLGQLAIFEGLIFIGLLAVGLIYIFKTGILNWER